MGGVFSKPKVPKQVLPPPEPLPEPEPIVEAAVSPDEDNLQTQRRKQALAAGKRAGRRSTLLSTGDDKLG